MGDDKIFLFIKTCTLLLLFFLNVMTKLFELFSETFSFARRVKKCLSLSCWFIQNQSTDFFYYIIERRHFIYYAFYHVNQHLLKKILSAPNCVLPLEKYHLFCEDLTKYHCNHVFIYYLLQSVPPWLAMEWSWLQTGWQGLQGGQGHTDSNWVTARLLPTSLPSSSSSSVGIHSLPPVTPPHPPPTASSPSLSCVIFLSSCFLSTSTFFFSDWNSFPRGWVLESLKLSLSGVQYELVEQAEPTGSRESDRTQRCSLQPLHRRPRDLPHGVWEPLETSEPEPNFLLWSFAKLHCVSEKSVLHNLCFIFTNWIGALLTF